MAEFLAKAAIMPAQLLPQVETGPATRGAAGAGPAAPLGSPPRLKAARLRRWLGLLALVLCSGWALDVVLWRPKTLEGQAPAGGPPRISGVVHVHTTLSDGGGTPAEVVAEAQAAGLGFLGLSDHNNLDAKPVEGYHGALLVLVGSEISTTVGHVLGLGIPDPAFRFSGDALDALEDVRDLGGVPFAAHAENARADLRFSGWDVHLFLDCFPLLLEKLAAAERRDQEELVRSIDRFWGNYYHLGEERDLPFNLGVVLFRLGKARSAA